MKTFRCKECGQIKSDYERSAGRRGVCQDCAEWLDSITTNESRPTWDLDWYREHFPELTLDRPTLDWLRQNY